MPGKKKKAKATAENGAVPPAKSKRTKISQDAKTEDAQTANTPPPAEQYPFRIRTITTFVSLQSVDDLEPLHTAARFNKAAQKHFTAQGYTIQTTRLSLNSWEDWLLPSLSMLKGLDGIESLPSLCEDPAFRAEVVAGVLKVEAVLESQDVLFGAIGPARTPATISLVPYILRATKRCTTSAFITHPDGRGIHFENARAAARAIRALREGNQGQNNFRFGALANCPSGIPFFPASFHTSDGQMSFALGLESSGLTWLAFQGALSLNDAERRYKETLTKFLVPLEELATELSRTHRVSYSGIDTSLAPSTNPDESVAFAFEELLPRPVPRPASTSRGSPAPWPGRPHFGGPGTLAVSAMVTRVLKSLSITRTGYSGLMFPVCEDFGLAQRASEGSYNIHSLLLYSAVCGCGLDTIPLPGDVTDSDIEGLLWDVACLADRLNKPLAARLFPVPGIKAGETTQFYSPYLINCKTMSLTPQTFTAPVAAATTSKDTAATKGKKSRSG